MKLDDGRRVRLYGIDCPEGRQETGDEATAFVRRMAEGEFFIIQRLGEDRYGRTVAILHFPDGGSLQEAILTAGYAWIAPRYCKRPECLEWKVLETQALKEKRGLWRHPRPLPPWQWRKQQLGGKHE